MLYVELIEKSKGNRNKFVPIGKVRTDEERDFEAYASMFPVDENILKYLSVNKNKDGKPSAEGYTGNFYCRYIWFDMDNDNLEKSLEDTRKLYIKLLHYGLTADHIQVYFSGGKGFHVAIPAELFGGFEPSNDLPYQIRDIAREIAGDFESFDTSIYNPNRYFRLPNSRHDKSGLYKVAITEEELLQLKIQGIIDIAKYPRTDFTRNRIPKILENEKLIKLASIAVSRPEVTQESRDALDSLPQDDRERFYKVVEIAHRKYSPDAYWDHNRNNFLFYIAALCNDAGIGKPGDPQVAYDLILEYCENTLNDDPAKWNNDNHLTIKSVFKRKRADFGTARLLARENSEKKKGEFRNRMKLEQKMARYFSTALTPQEVLEIALAFNATMSVPVPEAVVEEMVYYNAKSKKRAIRTDNDWGRTLAEMTDDFKDRLINFKKGCGLGIKEIDEAENYDYEGKVIYLSGLGGTGKSMLMKDIALHVAQSGSRGIYCSMEDTALRLFMRILDGVAGPKMVGKTPVARSSIYLQSLFNNTELSARKFDIDSTFGKIKKMMEGFGSGLIIDEKAGLVRKDIVDLVEHNIKRYGIVNFLYVDGIGSLGGGRNEVEGLIENSYNMKELAKEYNMGIMPISHVPGGVSEDYRDVYKRMRGGPKMYDNGDAFISISAIIDEDKPMGSPERIRRDIVFLRYYGKRTSGQTIDLIMRIDPFTLKMTPDYTLDPKDFIE